MHGLSVHKIEFPYDLLLMIHCHHRLISSSTQSQHLISCTSQHHRIAPYVCSSFIALSNSSGPNCTVDADDVDKVSNGISSCTIYLRANYYSFHRSSICFSYNNSYLQCNAMMHVITRKVSNPCHWRSHCTLIHINRTQTICLTWYTHCQGSNFK